MAKFLGKVGKVSQRNSKVFRQSWQSFAAQFGLPPRDDDLIVFFQGAADFAYDASVIYHEYTHAVIGINRLQGYQLDQYGVDSSPGGMNEGIADYFAATLGDLANVGRYGIGTVSGNEGRDLETPYQCPAKTHWEVHVHGRVIASTMWEVRQQVGAELADQLMFNALEQFNVNTTHQEAAELIVNEAETIAPDQAETVRSILLNFGLLDCVRSHKWEAYAPRQTDNVPYSVLGTQNVPIGALREVGVPAHKQFYIELPEDKAAVEVRWTVQAPQSGFGGMSMASPLKLGVRAGEPVFFTFGPTSMTADHVIEPELDGSRQIATFGRSCFVDGQPLHTVFLNPSSSELWVSQMNIRYLDEVDEADLDPCLPAEEPSSGGVMGGEVSGGTMGGSDPGGASMGDTSMGGASMGGASMGGASMGGELNGGTMGGSTENPDSTGGINPNDEE